MFNRLLSVIAPHECVGCLREGNVLCPECMGNLRVAYSHCYRCLEKTGGNRTCKKCLETSSLDAVYAAVRYNQPAVKHALWRLKFDRAQAAATDIARHLATIAPVFTEKCIIVPAPTATVRARQRGYDQACLIAKTLARLLPEQYVYVPALARLGTKRQLGNTREQRIVQLQDAFRVRRPLTAGVAVLLVDDVITTGATLQAAAGALKQAGAGRVEALVFAQA
jgi:ComF family protein